MARKVYVEVVARFSPEGTVLPRALIWEDERRYAIDRVLDIKPRHATKVGGHGIRYECRIGGQVRYLFREEDRWFVECDR